MNQCAITELAGTKTELLQYPVDAEVQAELEQWQEHLQLYGLENKFGMAFSDETARLETAKLPSAIATAASQAWGAVINTIKHSRSLKLEVEVLRGENPEFYLNGGWLMERLMERLPLVQPTPDGRRSAKQALADLLRKKLPVNGTPNVVDEFLAELVETNLRCGSADNGMLDEAGLARVLSDAVPEALDDNYDKAKRLQPLGSGQRGRDA